MYRSCLLARMSVLAEFVVPADEFLLGKTVETLPNTRVEIERVVADEEHVTPYFWATGDAFDRFEEVMGSDPSIEDVAVLEKHSDKRFYRASWRQDSEGIVHAISETTATILAASTEGTEWNVEMLFPNEETLSTFHDFCAAYGLSFELRRLYESRHPEALGKYNVTEKQREALVAALEAGYFSVPREVTLEELADRLDISSNALSTRLRRGHANLLTNTLSHEQ